MQERLKIGQILVRTGLIDDDQLQAALGEQARWGGRIGVTLVNMGFLSEEDLLTALGTHFGLPVVKLAGKRIAPEVLALLPADFAEKHGCIPLFGHWVDGAEVLYLGMEDPGDLAVLDDVKFRTGIQVRAALVGPLQIRNAIEEFYYGGGPSDPDQDLPARVETKGARAPFRSAPPRPAPAANRPAPPSGTPLPAPAAPPSRTPQPAPARARAVPPVQASQAPEPAVSPAVEREKPDLFDSRAAHQGFADSQDAGQGFSGSETGESLPGGGSAGESYEHTFEPDLEGESPELAASEPEAEPTPFRSAEGLQPAAPAEYVAAGRSTSEASGATTFSGLGSAAGSESAEGRPRQGGTRDILRAVTKLLIARGVFTREDLVEAVRAIRSTERGGAED